MRLTFRSASTLALAGAIFGLTACDNPPPAPTDTANVDAGPTPDVPAMPDTPRDTPTAPSVCASVREVTLTLGENTITGDTTGRGMDLGLTCNSNGETAAPQEAVELTVPGDAGTTYTLELSLANPGTAITYDTQLEVRPSCASDANAICNDDINYPDEPRSRLVVPVPGGTVLTAIVSGYQAMFAGAWEMTATVAEAHPPTLTGFEATIIDDAELRVRVMGADEDGDAVAVILEMLDAAGTAIAIDNDGDVATPDVSEFTFGFLEDLAGMTTFTGNVTVGGLDEFPELADATQLRIRVLDEAGQESAPPMTDDIADGTFVALGDDCDEAATFCPDGLSCDAMVCAVPADVVAACEDAAPIELEAPTATTPSSQTFDAVVEMSEGLLIAPCQAATPGDEDFFTLTVPAGDHDLIVTTAGTRTGEGDTVLYLMTTCGDVSNIPEEWCGDDVDTAGMDYSSIITIENIAAGDYSLVVEAYGAPKAIVPVGVTATLRAVLESGEACDMEGVDNRCAGEPCAAGTCP